MSHKININHLEELMDDDFEKLDQDCKEFNINYKREKKKIQEKRAEIRKRKKEKNEGN